MESLGQEKTVSKPRVFQNRNYSLLFWGILVSNIAHILFNFAISLYLLEVAREAFGEARAAMIQAGYLFSSGIVLVLLTPFGGVLADRLNKVHIMVLTDFLRGATILLAGAFLLLDTTLVWKIVMLFVMNILLSVNSAFFQPAGGSLLRFIVSDEELQPAASYLQGSHQLQSIIGLILGGILYAALPIAWVFFLNGLAYIGSAISEMFIRYHHPKNGNQKTTLKDTFADIKTGVVYLWNEKGVLAILTMALMFNFFVSPTFSNAFPIFIKFGLSEEPSYLFDSFLQPAHWYSILSIIMSIAAIIMSLVMSRRKTKERYGNDLKRALLFFTMPILLISALMSAYYADWIHVSVVLVGVSVAMFFLGIAQIAFNVPVSLIMQRKVERHMLGKVSSVSNVLSQALIPFSTLIAGAIIANLSITALYLFCSLGVVGVTVWFLKNKAADTI
jgi:MFS transporter, DHA3 family, macrolide efflux protein